jgi:hypothetical protein
VGEEQQKGQKRDISLSLTILTRPRDRLQKDSRQEYENRFVAIRQSNLEQAVFQVDKYIC